jgi:hypothetical protein
MKIRLLTLIVSAFALSIALSACYNDNEEDLYLAYPVNTSCDTTNVTYSASVAPVFSSYCSSNSCHGGSNPKAGISTTSYASVTANITKIRASINEQPGATTFMPKDGSKLSACDLTKIDIWINHGMPNN